MTAGQSEGNVRRIGIEHVHLADVDPRDNRLLRLTPCGRETIGLTVVERTENLPITETEVCSIIVDLPTIWNALVAIVASEGVVSDA